VVPQAAIAPQRKDAVRAMYLNAVANVDRAIGQVLSTVRVSLGADTGIIVVSDHGESLYDEGFLGHGYALNDVQTRIPLIVNGLPLTLEEPFAEADLRDAIRQGLSGHAASTAPTLRQNSSRQVFQYLGNLRRPAQIALTGPHDRIVYDFRSNTARLGAGEWKAPDDLGVEEHARFLNLIQTWERMMLARSANTDS
jgi:hypothetical protein